MGLDIYLYRYEDFNDTQKRETEYSEKTEGLWTKKYEETPEEEKVQIRKQEKEIAQSLALDEYGSDTVKKECIEIPSLKYPEHYFKIGYFRSSYNAGGIQRILRNLGIKDLNYIFSYEDEYEFQPNWDKALNRVSVVIEKLKQIGGYRAEKFGYNEFNGFPSTHPIKSEEDAMIAFLNEIKRDTNSEAYSNKSGTFYRKEPLKVLAIIEGVDKRFFAEEYLPCVYVITENDNEWYVQALEIVKETIEYVLSKEDKEKYYLHWSG